MKYLLILALLTQAPKPLPTQHIANDNPCKIEAGLISCREGGYPSVSPSPKLKVDNRSEPAPILMQDNGRTVLTVKDADIPVGPCDFGKLVRLVKWDQENNHGPVVVGGDAYSSGVFTIADGGGMFGDAPIRYTDACSFEPLTDQAVCRAERNLEMAKAERKRFAEWDQKWNDLRAELARCEPKPEPDR